MAEVRLDGVTKRWGDFIGVDKVDLAIADNEFLVLLGPSGCGKTTTMRMVAGLEEPTNGDILIGERRVNDLEPKDRDVAMVFQSYALYPNMSVYDNIRFPLKVRKVPEAEHHDMVIKAAEMVELGNLLERKPAALSGGQRQRVALARAIVRRPTVFLMDEPLSNLDAKLRVTMRAELKNLQHRLAVTTIYVTHDQIEAMTLADRVVVMRAGRIMQVGTPKDVYNVPANTFVASFIGSPAMNLVDGRMENGVFTAPTEGGSGFRIDGFTVPDGPVTLGFRAEDASVVANGAANGAGATNGAGVQAEAPIYSIELLGDTTMISIRSGEALVAVKGDKDMAAEIGQPVGFAIPPQICHLFSAETGERL